MDTSKKLQGTWPWQQAHVRDGLFLDLIQDMGTNHLYVDRVRWDRVGVKV